MSATTENRFPLGLASVILLVVLRVAVGWHFFYEGLWKYQEPNFSAEPYFRAAKGPFAETFRGQIPDIDGRVRLETLLGPADEAESAAQASPDWQGYVDRAAAHYGYSEEQKKQANDFLVARFQQAHRYVADNRKDVDEYLYDLERLKTNESDPLFRDVPFQQKRLYDKRTELTGKVEPWLKEIARIQQKLRSDLDELGAPESKSRGPAPVAKSPLDSVNHMTIWLTLGVGFCLMVGLFTRPACLVGAGFLALVVAVMPAIPNIYPPSHPSVGHALYINKEVIEMLVLLFMSTTAVGRWGGLDFILYHKVYRPLFGRKST